MKTARPIQGLGPGELMPLQAESEMMIVAKEGAPTRSNGTPCGNLSESSVSPTTWARPVKGNYSINGHSVKMLNMNGSVRHFDPGNPHCEPRQELIQTQGFKSSSTVQPCPRRMVFTKASRRSGVTRPRRFRHWLYGKVSIKSHLHKVGQSRPSNSHFDSGHGPFHAGSPGFSRFSRGDRLKPGLHTCQNENC